MRHWMKLAASGLVCLVGLGGCATTSAYLNGGAGAPISAARPHMVAISDIERAVAAMPSSADDRVRLGRSYLASGRFASAESAFADALTLDPSLGAVMVTRALTQLAQGHDADARTSLKQARGRAPDADLGLALALAGQRADAIALLEASVRRSGGDVRVRQNLALVYGLEGRWADAAAMAARDVPADQIGDRLRRWIEIVQQGPRAADQLIALLGVTPAIDPGQPAALALAKPVPVPASPEPALVLAEPVIAPTNRAVAPSVRNAGFVVQLGAYRSAKRLETVWSGLGGRAHYLSGHVPVASNLKRGIDGATLHRLAIGGFDNRADAMRLCTRIRADGGACFVRTTACDLPMQWATAVPSADRKG